MSVYLMTLKPMVMRILMSVYLMTLNMNSARSELQWILQIRRPVR
jgi:hypothetical protein